jgi:hypothetical protein
MDPDPYPLHSFLMVPYRTISITNNFFYDYRAPPAFICFRRGRDRPPLIDLGVLYEGQAGLAIKNPPKKTHPKNPPKNPTKNVFFLGFLKF